ncbi:MAG: GPW/gp25 family protein [Balneolaceae bacterium]
MASTKDPFNEENNFLGRGWSFPVHFNRKSSSVEMSEEEKDIRESLEILLSTIRGERVMRPDFGTNLHGSLFESMRTSTAARISEDIRRAILFHEPRINLEDISFRRGTSQGFIQIILEYTIIATNTRTNLVYPFYLSEATDI